MIGLNKNVSFGRIGKETLITNSVENKGMILDEIGTMIWEDIFTGMSVGEMVEKYANLFNEDGNVIEADVKEFLKRLDSFGVFG